MSVYSRDYRILSSDTDALRRLRISRLFTLLQEASIQHTTELGMGRDKTLDRGLLWIVTQQQAKITRMPVYDEEVRIVSWPGRTMHLFFPRYYRIEDMNGGTLIESSAIWALMDSNTRKVVFPEKHGIEIEGTETGREIPLPAVPRAPKTDICTVFNVPYSYIDLNGHMNNTRYFDLCEDILPPGTRSRDLEVIQTEYSKEAPEGTAVSLRAETDGSTCFISGETEGKKIFRVALTYR